MKTIRKFAVLPVLALAISAYAQDVRYNFASGTDFGKYKTYKWVQIKGSEQPDQITDQQIKQAIDGELSKKGLVQTTQTPDLLVGYQAALSKEQQVNMYDSGWGYGYGWGGEGL